MIKVGGPMITRYTRFYADARPTWRNWVPGPTPSPTGDGAWALLGEIPLTADMNQEMMLSAVEAEATRLGCHPCNIGLVVYDERPTIPMTQAPDSNWATVFLFVLLGLMILGTAYLMVTF